MKQGRSSTTKVSTTTDQMSVWTSVRWSAQPGRKDTALDRELTSDALHDLEVTCFFGSRRAAYKEGRLLSDRLNAGDRS